MPYNGFKYFSTPWTNHHTPRWLHTSSNCPTPIFHIMTFEQLSRGVIPNHRTPHACLPLLTAGSTSLPSPNNDLCLIKNVSPSTPCPCPLLTHQHVVVGVVRDGEEVRRSFVAFLPLVHLSHLGPIDGQPFVRVDRHAEEARVGLEVERNMRRGFKGCIGMEWLTRSVMWAIKLNTAEEFWCKKVLYMFLLHRFSTLHCFY